MKQKIKLILIALAIGLICRYFIHIAFIPTASMEPALQAKSIHVFVRTFREPQPGDIVLIESEQWLAKRVTAVGGQAIEARNGYVVVDGLQLQEGYLPEGVTTEDFDLCYVPVGNVFYLGDNRSVSRDSRTDGVVSVEKIRYILLF